MPQDCLQYHYVKSHLTNLIYFIINPHSSKKFKRSQADSFVQKMICSEQNDAIGINTSLELTFVKKYGKKCTGG